MFFRISYRNSDKRINDLIVIDIKEPRELTEDVNLTFRIMRDQLFQCSGSGERVIQIA